MSVRNWPRPIRLLIGWIFVAISLAIAFGPLGAFLLSPIGWSALNASGQVFAVYTAAVAGITAAVVSAFVCWRLRGGMSRSVAVHLVTGTLIGLGVGLCVTLPTLGASLIFSPPCAVVAAIGVVLIKIVAHRTSRHRA